MSDGLKGTADCKGRMILVKTHNFDLPRRHYGKFIPTDDNDVRHYECKLQFCFKVYTNITLCSVQLKKKNLLRYYLDI